MCGAKQALRGDDDQKNFLGAQGWKVVLKGAVSQMALCSAVAPMGLGIKERSNRLVRRGESELVPGETAQLCFGWNGRHGRMLYVVVWSMVAPLAQNLKGPRH